MVTGELSSLEGVDYYRIQNIGDMDPFLTTVVSDSDLWMFVSSTGALTAGRIDADHALFPYETDDRLHRAAGITGPVTVIAREVGGVREIWRPFGSAHDPACSRSIAKSVLGDQVIFEEHNPAWGLTYRASWAPADLYGWVRTTHLVDVSGHDGSYEVLDGFLDVMPAGVDAQTEMTLSNLVNAYKRSEAGPWGTLAVFTLESLITDRAEPAEALTATAIWSAGFEQADLELDGRAVGDMVAGRPRSPSLLLTGQPGAYLLRGRVAIPASETVSWMFVADTDLDQSEVRTALETSGSDDGAELVVADIERGSQRLRALLEDVDAFQQTADALADAHHLSNVLFNSMRGGVFPSGYEVAVSDFVKSLDSRNRDVRERHGVWLQSLAETVDVADLRTAAISNGDPDLLRLVLEYLPLTFSRRHGDPSRPWNRFSINVRDDVGDPLLSYEGNWRDIFQNWEALLHSYPGYLPHVVAKFVDASTVDGFNPYRISRTGIDWEIPDPDDPWSHIGYWGDHQIVYLMRLLEMWERFEPGGIGPWLGHACFSYADVPYVLAGHDEMVADPRNTITYDEQRAELISQREEQLGADGRLVVDGSGSLLRVGLLEKLLVPALAKLSSFVPDGGIWLNTQRPEWNDANNALAGPGLSMVTLYHLRRYLTVVDSLVTRFGSETVRLTASVAEWLADLTQVLEQHADTTNPVGDTERRDILDALGRSGASHRTRILEGSGLHSLEISSSDVRRLCSVAGEHLDRSIRGARRDDGLYHSYNRISFPSDRAARVDHLGPMLEGQVAILSAQTLSAEEVLALVDALFASEMYRPDQDTFMLYPATRLPSFLDRNHLPVRAVDRLGSLTVPNGPLERILVAGADGGLHFRPEVTNAAALERLLDQESIDDHLRTEVLDVYEQVFDHQSFTGRSGSMYGYEGLGSVYWHMVAKLLLAVQETYWTAMDRGESDASLDRLADAYRRIRNGLGFKKDPVSYGAFPTDCYSHTPAHAGAQQPGMTGQVKEEVLTRFGELGIRVVEGCATLVPGLLPPEEMLPSAPDDGFGSARFTVCGVFNTVAPAESDSVVIRRSDGSAEARHGLALSAAASQEVFGRTGSIERIDWLVGPQTMRRWKRSSES